MKPRLALLGGFAGTAVAGGLVVYRRYQAKVAADPNRSLSGAPVVLEQNLRSGTGVRGPARVAPPRWEPQWMTAFARWQPAPLQSPLARAAGYLWAAPITVAGVVAGAAAGVRPQLRDGVLLFAQTRGLTGRVLRARGYDAGAIGHVVLARGTPSDALLAHELTHVRQAERLGPLMAPVYLGLLALYGYARHPMERAARLAQRKALGLKG